MNDVLGQNCRFLYSVCSLDHISKEDSVTTFFEAKVTKNAQFAIEQKKCLNSLKCDLTSKKGKARWVWEGGWRGRAESFSVGQVTRRAGRPSRLKIAVCCPTGSCKSVVLKLPKSYQKVVSILSKSCLTVVSILSKRCLKLSQSAMVTGEGSNGFIGGDDEENWW